MRVSLLSVSLWMVACTQDPNRLDQDGDGFVASDECDDFDAAVNPDAEEACNGRDDNCDGEVDNNAGPTWFADGDGDAWGTGDGVRACAQPAGHTGPARGPDSRCRASCFGRSRISEALGTSSLPR